MDILNNQDILNFIQRNGSPEYLFFWGHRQKKPGSIDKSCLSQWFPASFRLNGVQYPTSEHYMMAQKAILFQDAEIAEKIRHAPTPDEVKKLGRRIKQFDEAVWQAERARIVFEGNLGKFSQNRGMQDFLLATADKIIVEASPVDAIWGVGMAEKDAQINSPANWRGLNLLGYVLMEVRFSLRNKGNTSLREVFAAM